jgi:predicted transcriptional regulator
MSKNVKVRVAGDGIKGFFDRAREHARKLDRGEELAPEITVSFQNASDMMRVLSTERIRLLRVAKMKATPVSDLAFGLKRDTRAVSRDVDLLERFGLLRTRYEKNPGHGRQRIVESRATRYQLVATI